MKILVSRLGALGDVVRTLPAVRLLRRTWPSARIGWVVEPPAAPLVAGHPDVDETIVFPRAEIAAAARRGPVAFCRAVRRVVSELRGFRPDLALDFQSSVKSGLCCLLSGAPSRVGFGRGADREASRLFATLRVPLEQPRINRVYRAVALARAAGALGGPLEIDLGLTEEELAEGRRRLDRLANGRRAVLIAPFSSRRQAWKRYPLRRWCEIARGLRDSGATPVVVAGPGEEDEARSLVARAGPGVALPLGLPLRALAALIAAGDLMIAGDTGPMHLAWAAGVPVIALFGPTDPVLNAPLGEGHVVLAPERPTERDAVDRFPSIDANRVLEHARRVLERGRPPRPAGPVVLPAPDPHAQRPAAAGAAGVPEIQI
ncbi:MAG: lipopolysaccharide heptosyltransferase family protein [Acidobacteria bacterium]|nr:MAG: lipopolysaccharide heptosyltransferase family protein [Acidobacteriota bacterium]